MNHTTARTIVQTVARYPDNGSYSPAVESAALAKFDRAMAVYGDVFKAINVALSFLRSTGIVGHTFGSR